jgi:UDP-glucose 4-epimerase
VADPSLAARVLGWRTQRSLADICRDGWAWQRANPWGYADLQEIPSSDPRAEVEHSDAE